MIDEFDRAFPRVAFARRVPPVRIATRMARRLQRKAGTTKRLRHPDVTLRERLPPPVFPPRDIEAERTSAGWRFAFLGEERLFGPDIDRTADGAGQLWRMNLHYMEWLEVVAADAGAEAILHWILANPPRRAGALDDGWNAYALSLRIVCWLQFLARHGAALETETQATIARSLAAQLDWLARFPETDLGGNHLVKNIKALAWGAACFDGGDASEWRALALALLRRELPVQVLDDGFHFERAPSYHTQVAADLIETRMALGADAPPALDEAIGGMVEAARLMAHPDGLPAQFGDSGLHMAYAPALLAEAARVGNRPEPQSGVLPDAGLAAFKSAGFSCFAKFGPLGADALPAHAHGDAGSVELSFVSHRLVVDQGVYEYVSGERRTASRAAASHNLTTPDSGDMADFFGEFRLGWRPEPRILQAHTDGHGLSVEVAHDGFARHAGGAVLSRRIDADANAVRLVDSLSLAGTARWTSRFLLHPDWTASEEDGTVVLQREGARIRFLADTPARLVDAVWWPDMGHERSTQRIVLDWPAAKQRMVMRFERG